MERVVRRVRSVLNGKHSKRRTEATFFSPLGGDEGPIVLAKLFRDNRRRNKWGDTGRKA